MTLRFATVLTAALLLVAAARADETAVEETWYVVTIDGAPVGFASETSIAEEGVILYRAHTSLTMTRMGTPLSMFLLTEEVCDPDGEFVRARLEMNASIAGVRGSAVRDGDRVEFTFETGGHTQSRSIPWEQDAVSTWRSEQLTAEWLDSSARELEFKIFDVNGGEFKRMRLVRGEAVADTAGGAARTLLPVKEYEGDGEVPVSTTWFDENHRAVRTVIVQLGMEVSIERITREEMASIELEPNFDIIRQSMIRCEDYPDPPDRVDTVTMRLEFGHPLAGTDGFDGPNQSVADKGEDWMVLVLSRDTSNRITLAEDARDEFLRPGRYIQSDQPRIRAVADSIRVATGREGWALAQALSAWVGDHMTEKGYSQGFASALEAMDTGAGDCTEHSVLLTALLRAAGIPARPAVGLAYANGVFIGHMWTEAYVDHWRTLDALDPGSDPIRVRVSAADDREAVDERGLVEAYAIVGGMKAKVTSFTSRSSGDKRTLD